MPIRQRLGRLGGGTATQRPVGKMVSHVVFDEVLAVVVKAASKAALDWATTAAAAAGMSALMGRALAAVWTEVPAEVLAATFRAAAPSACAAAGLALCPVVCHAVGMAASRTACDAQSQGKPPQLVRFNLCHGKRPPFLRGLAFCQSPP